MRHAALLIALLVALPASAQELSEPSEAPAPFSVVSFTANVPGAPLGFGAYRFRPSRPGAFLELRVMPALPPEADTYRRLTPQEVRARFGDRQTGTRTAVLVGNVGATLTLGRAVGVYAGAGIAYHLEHYSYHDPMYILGTNGTYWVPAGGRVRPNVVSGIIIPVSRTVTLQIGGELEPAGVVLGVGTRL